MDVQQNKSRADLSNENLCKLHDKIPQYYKILTSLTAGAFAGAVAKTVIAPLDRSKINFQVSDERPYSLRAVGRFLLATIRRDGVAGLWRGNTANVARVAPYVAVNFTAHEQWKLVLSSVSSTPTLHEDKSPSGLSGRHVSHTQRFLAGVLSGLTATTLTYPLDVAKARLVVTLQEQYRGVLDVLLQTYKKEGPRALYRGYVPSVLGIMPYMGIMFYTYETLKMTYTDYTGLKNPGLLCQFVFGGVSGVFGHVVSYPFDVVRRRMQTAGPLGKEDIYRSVPASLLSIYRSKGLIGGLYKGLTLNWIKGPIAAAVVFGLFEFIQIQLRHLKVFQTCEHESGFENETV